jgi:ATP-binding cassette subfamily B protein
VIVRGTVAQNISLGVPWATRAEIESAAARAHADGFIRALPNGFDSEVSEQGTSLSGGQRQRLAIARAVLRDGSILLLDEATSQVDAESEAQIAKAITEFGRERTVIAVAHRLSTMLAADRIVVMDRARVVDIGTHAELFDRCEVYARLVRAQMHAAPTPSP